MDNIRTRPYKIGKIYKFEIKLHDVMVFNDRALMAKIFDGKNRLPCFYRPCGAPEWKDDWWIIPFEIIPMDIEHDFNNDPRLKENWMWATWKNW